MGWNSATNFNQISAIHRGESVFCVAYGTKSGGGLGEQIKRCRRKTLGNAEQRENGMKAFSFCGTFLMRREKPGDDANFFPTGKENVDFNIFFAEMLPISYTHGLWFVLF